MTYFTLNLVDFVPVLLVILAVLLKIRYNCVKSEKSNLCAMIKSAGIKKISDK